MNKIFDINGEILHVESFKNLLTVKTNAEIENLYVVQGHFILLNSMINLGIDDGFFVSEKLNMSEFVKSFKMIREHLITDEEAPESRFEFLKEKIISSFKDLGTPEEILYERAQTEGIW